MAFAPRALGPGVDEWVAAMIWIWVLGFLLCVLGALVMWALIRINYNPDDKEPTP
jgi:hypothetical protein